RYPLVTGVQTCALPIYPRSTIGFWPLWPHRHRKRPVFCLLGSRWPHWRRRDTTPGAVLHVAWRPLGSGDLAHGVVEVHSQYLDRSEDRRVGHHARPPAP